MSVAPGNDTTAEPRSGGMLQLVAWCVTTAVFFPVLILGLGGNWRWVEGWIFALWFDAMMLSIIIYTYILDPALFKERSQRPGSKNQERWDVYVLTAVYVMATAWLIIMPLDAERFEWSPPFPLWLEAIGAIALVPALFFLVKATMENTYLSTLVRIQSDRGQQVVSTGVYGFVRHPLYLGAFLMMVGAPLLLGSLWGLAITVAGVVLLGYRILGEERLLMKELAGYEEYTHKVRYRVIPHIW